VFRPVAIIVAAIALARPGIDRDDATRYAKALQREAVEHGFDPFTGVALIRRESRWHPRAVSADGEDYGLSQIRARYIGACRHDADPLHAPSDGCVRVKRALLDGEYNIRVMATLITRNRGLCKDKTGSARFGQWLASYEGRNYPDRDKWCQPGDQTRAVITYRSWLITKLVPAAKKPPSSRSACPASKHEHGKRWVTKRERNERRTASRIRAAGREPASKHRPR